MKKKMLGRAVLRCKLCGKVKELTIQSSKEDYKHDYSTLTNLAHKCVDMGSDTTLLGKLELLGVHFNTDTVVIDAEEDAVIAFNQPPLKIDWSENDEH